MDGIGLDLTVFTRAGVLCELVSLSLSLSLSPFPGLGNGEGGLIS